MDVANTSMTSLRMTLARAEWFFLCSLGIQRPGPWTCRFRTSGGPCSNLWRYKLSVGTPQKVCEISSSRGGDYETHNLLGRTAVFLIECRPTFHHHDDVGSTYLWNVGRHSINTAVHPRRFWASSHSSYREIHLLCIRFNIVSLIKVVQWHEFCCPRWSGSGVLVIGSTIHRFKPGGRPWIFKDDKNP
jgi:hypothetical protein